MRKIVVAADKPAPCTATPRPPTRKAMLRSLAREFQTDPADAERLAVVYAYTFFRTLHEGAPRG